MYRLLIAIFLLSASPTFAACIDEVRALYSGGALDPFASPAHRFDTTITGADGVLKYEAVTFYDTPLKTWNGLKGSTVYLTVGNQTWSGTGYAGPWTATPNSLPTDVETYYKAHRDQMARNLRDVTCSGAVELGGQAYIRYDFTTQIDPDPTQGGLYFGSTFAILVDPETGLLMRRIETGTFAHYQPEPGTDRHEAVYTYDPAIVITAPK